MVLIYLTIKILKEEELHNAKVFSCVGVLTDYQEMIIKQFYKFHVQTTMRMTIRFITAHLGARYPKAVGSIQCR